MDLSSPMQLVYRPSQRPSLRFLMVPSPFVLRLIFIKPILQTVMQSQVLNAAGLSLIDSSFIALDATPVKANVSNNNPKSFKKDKFSKASPPKADKDCRLGVQTASNQHNEKTKYQKP